MNVEAKKSHHSIPEIYITFDTNIDATIRIYSMIFLWETS